MKRLQLFLSSLAWCLCLQAQQGSDPFFELGAGTVSRSSMENYEPLLANGIQMNVKTGTGSGYFVAIGYGAYSGRPSRRWSALFSIRARYENCRFDGSAEGSKSSPSSFMAERFEYSSVITMRSIAMNLPLAIAMRPAAWAEIRLGIEMGVAIPFGLSEYGTLVTNTDHFTGPSYTYDYTSTSSSEISRSAEDMPSVHAMFMASSGYRHRIGRMCFGPDVMYRISDLPRGNVNGSPWMFGVWTGWDLPNE